ncbi:MAG: DUF3336 domain-containing protein [Sphingomonadales bacterium]|nr:DUF3336 domain-containing protein [Sphingomonadales bacterium]MDE2569686.1 DUF3336 domain-containing protein [Sphingomonadales bacterium]
MQQRVEALPGYPKLAKTYQEWRAAAHALDKSEGLLEWRRKDQSEHYDYRSVKRRIERIRALRADGDNRGLLFALNEGIHGNLDGMANDQLWRSARSGTKNLIGEYFSEVAEALDFLASDAVTDITHEEKLDFFQRASHCYGCSALMLSGSGSYLYFHVGVAMALREQGVLPTIISGSSGGALVGAVLCCHTGEELDGKLTTEELHHAMRSPDPLNLPRMAGYVPQSELHDYIEREIPDYTFLEAFQRTGRQLNISVAPSDRHQNGRLLNAITSPNVMIREAVLASCAVPGIYDPVQLNARDDSGRRVAYLPGQFWADGSITHDLPFKRLARLYGVNHRIVSQANPLARPWLNAFAREGSTLSTIHQAAIDVGRTMFNAQMALLDGPLSHFPRVHALARLTSSVVNQEYLGDINIIRPLMPKLLHKVLSMPTPQEIETMIACGERETWPQIEKVRLQSLVSRVLRDILRTHEAFGVFRSGAPLPS